MRNNFLRLQQLSDLTGIKRHTLNARLKSNFQESELHRTGGNQIQLTPKQTKEIIKDELYPSNGSIIYVGNLKGGVGKTTLVYMLAETLSSFGLKTCAIDLDVQANLTNQFIPADISHPVFLDLLDSKATVSDLLIEVSETLSIIPSSLKNSLIEKSLTVQRPRNHLEWLNELCLNELRSSFDVILVDTPPSLSTLNSVFCLCLNRQDSILVPVAPEEFSILGVQMFLDDVFEIRKSFNQKENVNIKVLMNRFFQTQKSNLEVLVKMNELYGDYFSEAILKDYSKIREMINNKLCLSDIKSGKEIYAFLKGLLTDLHILKGDQK